MVKFCTDCGNATETPFICSHCEETLCPDCAEDYDDDESFFNLEEKDVLFSICRVCMNMGEYE